MHLPPLELIKNIGDELILENNFIETKIDEIINNILGLEELFNIKYE
jgi:hypothetical protein